jgi:hypothetical protein
MRYDVRVKRVRNVGTIWAAFELEYVGAVDGWERVGEKKWRKVYPRKGGG